MSERNNKLELLGSAPIPKALMALGIPIMIGMLINALYNLVDAYFVGGLGESQMGAISVVFPLGQVVVGLGLMFGNGAASYLSRLLGRGNKDTANRVASTALYSSILIGTIIILFSTIFLKPIFGNVGCNRNDYAVCPDVLKNLYTVLCFQRVQRDHEQHCKRRRCSKDNHVCVTAGSCIEYRVRPSFYLHFQHGGCWCSNRHCDFTDGIYTRLSYIRSAKKKRIFIQRKSIFSNWANDGGNLENWYSYFGVPVTYKPFDYTD